MLQIEKKETSVIQILENHSLKDNNQVDAKSYLVPNLFNELTNLFILNNETRLQSSSSIYFPIMRWYGLSWLLKLYFDFRYEKQMKEYSAIAEQVAGEFLSSYVGILESEQKTLTEPTEGINENFAHWSEDGSRVNVPGWIFLALTLYKNGNLKRFLFPDLHFHQAESKYDKRNQQIAGKIRTHIKVLLELLKQLKEPTNRAHFEKEVLDMISTQTEEAICSKLDHQTHNPREGKYDILDETYSLNRTEPLLSQLAKSMHGFKNPNILADVVVSSGDMAKLLTLLDYVTSESMRQIIIKHVQVEDVEKLLESYHWIPDVQNMLERFAKYPELLKHTEKAIDYWTRKVISRNATREQKEILFGVQLLHAYFKRDQKALMEIEPLPDTFGKGSSDLVAQDYKDFYQGLFLLKDDPLSAYNFFNRVFVYKPKYISFGLKRSQARLLQIARIQEDNSNELQLAYFEWESFKMNLPLTTKEQLEPEYSNIELVFLRMLKNYEEADKLFDSLPAHQKYTPNILETQVLSLQERDRISDALNLVRLGDEFHYYPNMVRPSFIAFLKDKLDGMDNLQELQVHYLRIMSVEPEKLVKIFPTNLNGNREVVPFLIKEFIIALNTMLEKIKSIDEIGLEDKYNDLVEALLNARINIWDWMVKGQSRGSFSGSGDSGKQPGERDLPVVDKNGTTLLICEAFILRDRTRAESHILKVFNYHHRKNAFCVLVYDTGEIAGTFEQRWEYYLKTILTGMSFPAGLSIVGSVEEISKVFSMDYSAIRVAKTNHGDGTVVYHIFVNIHYSLV